MKKKLFILSIIIFSFLFLGGGNLFNNGNLKFLGSIVFGYGGGGGSYGSSSTRSYSSGGGGGVTLTKDNCPDGDYSNSYYDKDCGTKPIENTTTTITKFSIDYFYKYLQLKLDGTTLIYQNTQLDNLNNAFQSYYNKNKATLSEDKKKVFLNLFEAISLYKKNINDGIVKENVVLTEEKKQEIIKKCQEIYPLYGNLKFIDITNNTYINQINFMKDNCGVKGSGHYIVGNTTMSYYKPNDPISTGEAIKIIVNAQRLKSGEMTLQENKTGHWTDAFVSYALTKGIVLKTDNIDVSKEISLDYTLKLLSRVGLNGFGTNNLTRRGTFTGFIIKGFGLQN